MSSGTISRTSEWFTRWSAGSPSFSVVPPEMEAVAAERNRQASDNFAGYAKSLYEDAGIARSVLDTPLSGDDPLLKTSPEGL